MHIKIDTVKKIYGHLWYKIIIDEYYDRWVKEEWRPSWETVMIESWKEKVMWSYGATGFCAERSLNVQSCWSRDKLFQIKKED